jgi:hypothetical protein
MVVRKLDLSSSYRVTSQPMSGVDFRAPVSPQKMNAVIAKAKADPKLGARGAKILRLAYDAAKVKSGTNPTREQVSQQISRALSSLSNERAKGRINDGYVDAREAALVKGELAAELYKLFDSGKLGKAAPTPAKELAAKASIAKINQALAKLEPIVDKGFKLMNPDADDVWEDQKAALRKAANEAGLPAAARSALLTALNGASSRGDGDSGPDAADVKQLLRNAAAKLKGADGALIVNFAHPERKPQSKKDGIVSGLEVDRTPAVTGMTSRALLEYAATL